MNTTYALGRYVHHDERSRNFPYRVAAVKPKTIRWCHSGPVLNQGQLGSCTGNALAQWANTEFAQHDSHGPGRYLNEDDAIDLYSRATHLDDVRGVYPPTDSGSSGLAVCKAGVRRGLLDSYRHTFGFQALLMALQHTPVIAGTTWLKGMFTPNSDAVLTVAGEPAGGHEYLILGCDMEKQLITILNSWSASWGDNGQARIRFEDYEWLLGQQGDVTVPVLPGGATHA